MGLRTYKRNRRTTEVHNVYAVTVFLQNGFERLSNLDYAASMLEEQFPEETMKQRVRFRRRKAALERKL